MKWGVEFTDEFHAWWNSLTEKQQDEIAAVVGLLEEHGVTLGFPRSSDVRGSRYGGMRELRIQVDGDALRILYAFDPRRVALLLLGGRKTDKRWYKKNVPMADSLFEAHLKGLNDSEGDR